MKHLIFAFFFVILGLGQEYAQAQDKTEPTKIANPTTSNQEEHPKERANNEQQAHKDNNNQIGSSLVELDQMRRKEVSIDSRTDKLAPKAIDWAKWQTFINAGTLALAMFATIFAGLAWRAARKGVNVTNKATEFEYRPYLEISPITLKNGITENKLTIHHVKGRNHVSVIGSVTVKNIGRSPLITRNISGNMTVDFIGIEVETIKQPVGKSDQEHEVAPNGGEQELTIFLSFNLPKKFRHMDVVELKDLLFTISLRLTYDDMFSLGVKRYKYIWFDYWGVFEDGGRIELNGHGTSIRKTDVHKSKRPKSHKKRKTLNEFLKLK